MAGTHCRYSYPGGDSDYLTRDTTAVRECVSNILSLGVPDIVRLGGGVTASVYVMQRYTIS